MNDSPKTLDITALQVIKNIRDGVMITDSQGNIQIVNAVFSHVTGYLAEEVIGKNPRLLKSGRQDAEFYKRMWTCIHETGYWQGEIWNRRKNGEIYAEWLSISAIKDDSGRVTNYMAIFTDITGRKISEERMSFLAYYDALTGLPNRLLLRDRLQQALSQANRYKKLTAVLFLDLDYFKTINDSFGHLLGDLLLKAVAERLKECVREGDTVARLGGDEFVIVLVGIDHCEDALKVAQKIIPIISKPFHIDGNEILISTSIGMSLYPTHGHDPENLIKNADIAMYTAKDHGRNSYRLYEIPIRV